MKPGSTAHDSFNARSLDPMQVASTFIPPSQFRQLTRRNNSLVVGPRGSGKTTLLKMLQGSALERWTHASAGRIRRSVDYTGVFVATDVAWLEQMRQLGGGTLDEGTAELFSQSAFTTHVLRALVDAMAYRAHGPRGRGVVNHRRANLRDGAEAELVQLAQELWHLPKGVPSLKSLRIDLSARLSALQEVAAIEARKGKRGRTGRLEANRFLFLDPIRAAEPVATEFDQLAGTPDARWALLFDELDLAPTRIRLQLLAALRSVEPRFLFKLSMSPFSADVDILSRPEGAMAGQDFDLINLTYPKKEDGYRFARGLFESVLEHQGLGSLRTEDVVGISTFETPASEWAEFGTAYHHGSRLQRRFAELATTDPTFQQYLERREIDVRLLEQYGGDARAAEIRKITALVAVRAAFRSDLLGKRGPKRRSRKSPDIYSGATALFAITEANPRWLLGLAQALVDRYNVRGRRVSEAAQAAEIVNAAGRFLALLRTLKTPLGDMSPAPGGLLRLLDPIGEYLSERTIDAPFEAEPPATFRIDPLLPKGIIEALGMALNAGAIVRVPNPEDRGVVAGVVGHKYRLSYLLAPHYYLPIRLGRSIDLSHLLSQTVPEVLEASPGQLTLGEWSENA